MTNTGPALDDGWMSARYRDCRRREATTKACAALAGIVILSAGIPAAWTAPQAEDPAVLLRAAIEKEEVDGDLEAAIEQYKHVIKIAELWLMEDFLHLVKRAR